MSHNMLIITHFHIFSFAMQLGIKVMISNVFLHLLTYKDEYYLLLHIHRLLHINDDFSIKCKCISHMVLNK